MGILAALLAIVGYRVLNDGAPADVSTATVGETGRVALPSTDPYEASQAYAACLRAHGVPHPDPDRRGDFQLTPEQERRLRSLDPRTRNAAEDACFRHLKGLNNRPLSKGAIRQSKKVLGDLAACIRRKGYGAGPPVVENLPRGKARFGLGDPPGAQDHDYWRSPEGKEHRRAMLACEKEVGLSRRLSKIIDEDRRVDGL